MFLLAVIAWAALTTGCATSPPTDDLIRLAPSYAKPSAKQGAPFRSAMPAEAVGP